MRRFLLVRHATPTDGAEPHLSDVGRAEAEALAERLAGVRIDAAWSSDLNRAAETARFIVARHDRLALQYSPLLREYAAPPDVNQQDYAEIERLMLAQFQRDLAAWLASSFAPPGGADAHEQTVLVVAHAGPLRVLLCLLLDLPPERHWGFRFDRASLTVVDRAEDMGTLTLLNDRCHIAPRPGLWSDE